MLISFLKEYLVMNETRKEMDKVCDKVLANPNFEAHPIKP